MKKSSTSSDVLLLNAGQIKVRNIFIRSGGFLLSETVETELGGIAHDAVVLHFCDIAFQFGEVAADEAERRVLVHNAHEDIFREGICGYPVHDTHGIVSVGGKYEVADNGAFQQTAAGVVPELSHLFYHGGHGFGSIPEIIGGGGIFSGDLRGKILYIGEVNVDVAVHEGNSIRKLVTAGVIDYRYAELVFAAVESAYYQRNEVSGSDELDVVRALVSEFEKNIGKPFHRDRLAEQFIAYDVVLAEFAVEAAP